MLLSRSARIALAALAELDPRGPAAPGLLGREVARRAAVPAPYLLKVLQRLALMGLLRSRRGRGGGFVLGRPAAEISVADVLLALEGTDDLDRALPPDDALPDAVFGPIRRRTLEALKSTTLADLGRG